MVQLNIEAPYAYLVFMKIFLISMTFCVLTAVQILLEVY